MTGIGDDLHSFCYPLAASRKQPSIGPCARFADALVEITSDPLVAEDLPKTRLHYWKVGRLLAPWNAAGVNTEGSTTIQESSHRRARGMISSRHPVAPQSAWLCANAGPHAIDSVSAFQAELIFIEAKFNGTGVRSPYISIKVSASDAASR